MTSPLNATDTSFERAVLQAPAPAVAVFWSPDSTSRATLNALLDEAARAYDGEALIVKLQASDAPGARARYDVESLPEFLFFRDGTLVARAKGMPSLNSLRPWIEYLLGRGARPVATSTRRAPTGAPSDHPVAVTDADFDKVVLRVSGPVLVDFWAAWCGPCRMVAPILERLASEYAGRATVAKLDVDANPRTAQRYGVQSIPTLIYFRDGREVDRVVGAGSADVLRQKLAALL